MNQALKANLIAILCLFITTAAFSQQGSINGTVKDANTGEGLFPANVVIDVTKGIATTTDFDGNYELSVDPGTYTVKYSYIGYVDQEKEVTVSAGQAVTLNIELSDQLVQLGVTVVSASKYEKKLSEETVSIEVLTPDLIENSNSTDLEDAIDKVPGVIVIESQANIRGGAGWTYGAGSRVLMLVDDIPFLSADAADVKWSVVPVENTEQIEVIKGAASALYGSSALNGIINVRTAWPKSEPYTKISVSHGIYETPKNKSMAWWDGDEDYFVDWSIPQGYADSAGSWVTIYDNNEVPKITRVDSLFSANDMAPYLNFIRGDRGNGSAIAFADNKSNSKYLGNQPLFANISLAHRQRFGNLDLVLGGNYFADRSPQYGGSHQRMRLNTKLRYRFKNVEGLSLGVNTMAYTSSGSAFFLWQGNDSLAYVPMPGTISNYRTYRFTVDPFLDYFDSKDNHFSFRGRFFNARNENDTEQGSVPNLYYGEIQYQRMFDKPSLNFVAGVAGYFQDVFSPTGDASESLIGEHQGYNTSVYAQIDKKFKDVFSIALGSRYEYFKIDTFKSDSRPVFRVGLNYQAAEATFIRGSYGEGYRFPTMAEKFINTTVGAVGIYPNPNLRPEEGWSAELGLKQGLKIRDWLGYIDVAGFINQYKDMMEFNFGQFGGAGAPSFGLGFSAQNVGDTRILGTEITLFGNGKIGSVPVNVLGGYTFIQPTSLNWTDPPLTLINADGTVIDSTKTYSETASTDQNILKYRNRHMFKIDVEGFFVKEKLSLGLSVLYLSFMENIDSDFEDELGLASLEGLVLSSRAFTGIREQREAKNKGDVLLDARISYQINDQAKIALICKNLLNEFSARRPAYPDPPRNWALQFAYEFGKKKEVQ